MEVGISITNLTKSKINLLLAKKTIKNTVVESGIEGKNFDISLVFATEAKIKELNRIYRKKDKVTDVLSFNYDSGYNKKGKALEGELVLCPKIIAKHAKENKVSFQKELAFVLSHGVLHLLGFRHGERMYSLQDRISNLKFYCG